MTPDVTSRPLNTSCMGWYDRQEEALGWFQYSSQVRYITNSSSNTICACIPILHWSMLCDRRIDHPSFNMPNFDIALLRLSEAVDFSNPSLSHVFPACWPSLEPKAGQKVILLLQSLFTPWLTILLFQAIISGWGRLNEDSYVYPNIMLEVDCQRIERIQKNIL